MWPMVSHFEFDQVEFFLGISNRTFCITSIVMVWQSGTVCPISGIFKLKRPILCHFEFDQVIQGISLHETTHFVSNLIV